jgi:pentatricopeptide repeat protein
MKAVALLPVGATAWFSIPHNSFKRPFLQTAPAPHVRSVRHRRVVVATAQSEPQSKTAAQSAPQPRFTCREDAVLAAELERLELAKTSERASASVARDLLRLLKRRSKDSCVFLTPKQLGRLLAGCVAAREWVAGWNLLLNCSSYGLSTDDPQVYQRALKSLGRFGYHAACRQVALLAERVLEPEELPSIRGQVVGALRKGGRLREAVMYFDSEIRGAGLVPTLHGYTQYTKALAGLGLADACVQVISEMAAAGMPGDNYIYCNAMTAYAKSRDWEGALRLLHSLRAAGTVLDVFTYSSAVNALGNSGRQVVPLEILRCAMLLFSTAAAVTVSTKAALQCTVLICCALLCVCCTPGGRRQ